MPLKLVRNNITRMRCDAIVNTANAYPVIGAGCDATIYNAAGRRRLLAYRKKHIGIKEEGDVFITPAFRLKAHYIIHAVSPSYHDGTEGEEEKLRSCYRKSLELARQYNLKSIAFPLIATGNYQYPKEEGMRIAADEINAFLLHNEMLVYLVLLDEASTRLGKKIYPDLPSYIDRHYAERISYRKAGQPTGTIFSNRSRRESIENTAVLKAPEARIPENPVVPSFDVRAGYPTAAKENAKSSFYSGHESKLAERIEHLQGTFSEYLMYLIESKGMSNAEVYKRAIVDKKAFSKIKNNKDAHPQKITAMCLCVGAMLNIDETRDLLARAGYALSPSNKTDIIFSYFIENQIYDMIELDIQLEEYGLPCLIS